MEKIFMSVPNYALFLVWKDKLIQHKENWKCLRMKSWKFLYGCWIYGSIFVFVFSIFSLFPKCKLFALFECIIGLFKLITLKYSQQLVWYVKYSEETKCSFYSVQITYEVDHSSIPCYSLSLKSQWLILCHVSKQKISSVEGSAAWKTFSTVSYRLAQIISLSGQSSSSPSLVFSLFMKR